MKLYKEIKCPQCEGTGEIGRFTFNKRECPRCKGLGVIYQKVDPATLDLAALGVLGELRGWLKTGIEYFESLEKTAMNQERIHRYKMVLEKVTDLESAADLKAVREMQVKAKILDEFVGRAAKLGKMGDVKGSGLCLQLRPLYLKYDLEFPVGLTILEKILYGIAQDRLAQARAELATDPGKEKGEEKDAKK